MGAYKLIILGHNHLCLTYVFQINIRQQRVKFQRIKFIKIEVEEHLHPLLTAIQISTLKPLAS